jgi:hypothetical protein
MAKPRVFISSTCYDLKDVRSSISAFFDRLGFEVLNSEDTKTFGVNPDVHSHTACLEEVKNSDYMVLIIGGRSGGTYIRSTNTITNEEFDLAQKLRIPVIAFVRKDVYGALRIYKSNPTGDFKSIVDNPKVFNFIDYVSSGHEANWLHPFETATDIESILKTQIAHYLLNYSKHLRGVHKKEDSGEELAIVSLPTSLAYFEVITTDQDQLTSLRKGTRIVHKIIENIIQGDGKEDGKYEKLKTLWVFGCYDVDERKPNLKVAQAIFKDRAWTYGKARRVFESMTPLQIGGDVTSAINAGSEDEVNAFQLWYEGTEEERWDFKGALNMICRELSKRHTEKGGYKMFCRGDFRFLGDA